MQWGEDGGGYTAWGKRREKKKGMIFHGGTPEKDSLRENEMGKGLRRHLTWREGGDPTGAQKIKRPEGEKFSGTTTVRKLET